MHSNFRSALISRNHKNRQQQRNQLPLAVLSCESYQKIQNFMTAKTTLEKILIVYGTFRFDKSCVIDQKLYLLKTN